MKSTRVIAAAVMVASLCVGALHAQSLRNGQEPAEYPPSSYRGAQYVDSQGCVFIRAGIDGNVTWVPRVTRQRKLICGQKPSLSAQASQAARTTPQSTAPARKVEQITIAPSAAPAAAPPAVRAPAPRAARPAPAPAPTRTVRVAPSKPVMRAPAAPVVIRTAPVPAPVRTATVTARQPACTGASAISSRYINSGARAPVRCGPQPVARGTKAGRTAPAYGNAPAPGRVNPETRIVPRTVYDARQAEGTVNVPDGYRSVWEDDRLNPRRAEQSFNGVARTRLVWTQTVPRRLIEQRTGRDVTSKVALVYPYTDIATQQRELGTVTLVRRDGQLQKRIVRNKSKARAPTVSTRSAPQAVVTPPKAQAAPVQTATAKGQYIQVGTFGQPANAQAAAQRIARTGLPARIGKLTRGGKRYQVVLAGPFGTPADLGHALRKTRNAGFRDAFVR